MIRRPPGAELLPRYPPWVSCPVAQTVDITPFNTTLVPAGEDQAPLIEQINEITRHISETVKYQKESETIRKRLVF
jgi:tryptophanyl-tRNA synthetase